MKEYPTMKEVIGKYNHQKWKETETERKTKAEQLNLLSKNQSPFYYLLNQEVLKLISHLEKERGFLLSLKLPRSFAEKLAENNINHEAYYSSRIEGAVTSLEAAMLNLKKPKKKYADESLQMIINNKNALQYIYQQKNKNLTHALILKLQEILVFNTHKTESITVGAYRKGPIYVVDGMGRVVYEGPAAAVVYEMMQKFMDWINQENVLHPLIKAALVHLYFVHIHPFDDGNGRSARALSNLYLANQNYQFINFLSPSNYFDHHRSEYYQSIRDAEEHQYDATYFIIYFLKALSKQLAAVKEDIQREEKVQDIKNILGEKKYLQLTPRQIKALNLMLNTPQMMTTKKYCKINRCSDETARKDFNGLIDLKLIRPSGQGRAVKYILVI